MDEIHSAPQSSNTQDQNSNVGARIPAGMRQHFTHDGLYKVFSVDFGTTWSSVQQADVWVKSGKFTNLTSISPQTFRHWPGTSHHRSEETKEIRSQSFHLRKGTDGTKAAHGYEAEEITQRLYYGGAGDETYGVFVNAMKVALYPGREAEKRKTHLRELGLDIPYMVEWFKNSKLVDHPETWAIAEFVYYMVETIKATVRNDGKERPPFWIFTIPSIYGEHSHRLWTYILEFALSSQSYYIVSEVTSAVGALMIKSPNQSTLLVRIYLCVSYEGRLHADYRMGKSLSILMLVVGPWFVNVYCLLAKLLLNRGLGFWLVSSDM